MWNSQTVLLALIRKGLTREQAYDLVQRNAMKTWEVKHAGREDADFLEQLQSDPEVARHFQTGELSVPVWRLGQKGGAAKDRDVMV
jgi:adenylosuccinate lyase